MENPQQSPSRCAGGGSVVVGLTASPASQSALRWAAGYARLTGVRLRAVCVHPQRASDSSGLRDLDRSLDWSVEARRTIDAEFVAIHPRSGWTLVQTLGDPGPDLVRTAENADLLVIGRHLASPGRRRPQVAAYCAERSTAPVVIVPFRTAAEAGVETAASRFVCQAGA